MSDPNTGLLQSLWRHLPETLAEFPLLTAGEQTKLSWARRIESPDEAPPCFQKTIQALIADTGSLPYLVLTPSQAGFIVRTTEKLVCCLEDEIRIYAQTGAEPQLTAFRLGDISALEVGCVLLKSWLQISGRSTAGVEARIMVKFNTVNDYLFLPIISKIRGAPQVADRLAHEQEQARFNYLAHDFYKFMNVAKKSIVPGDHIVGSIMQSELRTPLVTLFGRSYSRLRAPAHIVVRTDRELILAVEENQEVWRGSHKYGSVRTYIPLAKLATLAFAAAPAEDTVTLVIDVVDGEQLRLEFAAAQELALRELLLPHAA